MRSIYGPLVAGAFTCLFLNSCGAGQSTQPNRLPQLPAAGPHVIELPTSLPQDALQPWEAERASTALDAGSEFTLGTQRFLEGGTVLDAGAASRIGDSNGSGDGISYAIYRLPMAGQQPGALAFDINILADATGGSSEYFIGLSNYADGRWEWHGPYGEHHVRLARSSQPGPDVFASADYTSEFDNLFVNVLVSGSSQVDVLGVTTDSLSSADGEAPPVPDGLAATAVAGGIALTWDAVAAADLAGYRIHYAKDAFSSVNAAGVRHAGFVEGSTRHLLAGLAGELHIRITSIDNNGNESAPSAGVISSPLAGDVPPLRLEVSSNSVPRSAVATVEVLGGDGDLLYDFDLDGDGIFELSGEASAQQALPTQETGLIRPAVRAVETGGERMALGGVSLLVTSNSRPVADALASVQFGTAPLSVDFDGSGSTDFDGTIVGGGWDFDGDGIYDAYDEASTINLNVSHQYTEPGFHNARLRVIDDEGAWDVDTVGIFVDGGSTQDLAPVANLTFSPQQVIRGVSDSPADITLDASSSFDPESGPLEYSWDVNGDGAYATYTSESSATYSTFRQGLQYAGVRVRDEAGNVSQATVVYPVYQFSSLLVDDGRTLDNNISVARIDTSSENSRIGIAYYDQSNDDLVFSYSYDPSGRQWSQPDVLDAAGGEWMNLIDDTYRFMLGYYRDGDLFYTTSYDGGKSFEPAVSVDVTADNAGLYVDGAVHTNKPGFAYYNATDGDLYYCVATDSQANSFETPVAVDGTGDTGLYPSAMYSGGRVSIAYYREDTGNLMFAQSTDTNGQSWNPPVIVDGSAQDVGIHPSMLRVGGNNAIAYVDSSEDVWFVQSTNSLGNDWNDPVAVPGNFRSEWVELLVVNDRFVIISGDSFFGFGEYAISTDLVGDEWSSWQDFDLRGTTSYLSATTLPNGLPGAAFYNEDDGELMFSAPRLD